jgi:DnaK suppressor protein
VTFAVRYGVDVSSQRADGLAASAGAWLTGGRQHEEDGMDLDQARARLLAELAEVADLLKDAESAGRQDRDAAGETGDIADAAQPLTAEGQDDAVAETMRNRLAAIDRALLRLEAGTYGRSVRSGEPITSERLEADPAAELTIEEARASG